MSLIDPPIATCELCPGWEVPCASDAERERREALHNEAKHAELVTEDTWQRMVDDHPDEHAMVVRAIEADAAAHGGTVNPNRVRELIPTGVTPQVIGPTYSLLKKQGRLLPVADAISTDRRGRNVGKRVTIYHLLDLAGQQELA